MRNIAIIPARSGSKGLIDKNIKLLNGKPLIAYTIEAAVNSKMFDVVFVSTDSEKYADIAIEHGAKAPFLRSSELATDTASSWDVVKGAISKYNQLGKQFDTVSLLQPTSPLRRSEDIVAGYKLMSEKNANAIVGVCETDHSPLWSNILPDDNSLDGFISREIQNMQRQSLPKYYRINGALYIINTQFLYNPEFNLYSNGCYAYVMDKSHSVDIDDETDFKLAEFKSTQ